MHPGSSPFDARDPRFIHATLPALALALEHWHRFELRGLDEIPSGAALVVGNHNGGIMSPDMFALMLAYWRRFGADAPAYGLMHDFVFRVPVVGRTMARLGVHEGQVWLGIVTALQDDAAGEPPRKGGILQALLASPLRGSDLDLVRPREDGRLVDL